MIHQGSKACPRCGTEWPQADLDELDLADATEQIQAHSSAASQRTKRSTRMKAEAVEAVQTHGGTQTEAPQVPVTRKRLRSYKTEPEVIEDEDEASQFVAPTRVRTRRSHKG